MRAGRFVAAPGMRQVDRWTWRTDEPLVFDDPVEGVLTVPAGEVSDLASIRSMREVVRVAWVGAALLLAVWTVLDALGWEVDWLWWWAGGYAAVGQAALVGYALLAGYAVKAALLHDHLYRTGALTRRRCDAVFFRACRTGEGLALWRSALFWCGPAVMGSRYYRPS